MRDRLGDWCCLVHLAHINPTKCRVETWLESKTRLETEFLFGSIRSTSRSFTTRLVLVIASRTDENILRIETV